MKELIEKVSKIQKELKAPKNQYNSFGKYNYRNQEDILESVKPLLANEKLVMTITDEVVDIGGRFYVKANVTITDGVNSLTNSALARETEDKKGMDAAQVTGATSSYARKYALNGMFLIDDTKDADSDEVTSLTKDNKTPSKFAKSTKSKETTTESKQEDNSSVVVTENKSSFRRSFKRGAN